MMKHYTLFYIFLLCSLTATGQAPVVKKCKTCKKPLKECPYKGKHPAPAPTPAEKKCSTCGKPVSKCQYNGKHPAPEAAGYDVSFSCNVSSATLYIDGTVNGTASGSRFLKTGSHSVKLTAQGYEDYSTSITVNSGHRSFSFTMKKSQSVSAPPASSSRTFTVQGVSFVMVPVEGGTFQMGGTSEQGSDAYNDEKPVHSVTLSSYSIGQTEVTQALWQAVMGSNPSSFKGSKLPVEQVSWEDCQTFIEKLNQQTGAKFRLPTEAEWEFAARGGRQSRGYKYSGSNTIDDVAWYDDNSGYKTHEVGTKRPNELGLYDMSGNVWEWCQDWKGSYSSSSQTNPTGASSGSGRVDRGGGWCNVARFCRSSNRDINAPSFRDYYLGLRLAL